MPVKFTSHVEQNSDDSWFIELTDSLSHKSTKCKDLDEYKIKLEEFASEYGYDIEVAWSKSKDLSPKNIEDINEKMALLQKEYESEISQINS